MSQVSILSWHVPLRQLVTKFVKKFIISIHTRVSQITTSSVPFRNVMDVVKDLEMIKREGFEQHEDQRDN